jgi:putative tryptophan/tyrosine transport system substrate-binding protein
MYKANRLLKSNRYRWAILALAALALFVFFGCSEKEPKVYRVGVLIEIAPFLKVVEGFKAKMHELSYIENKNITYDLKQVTGQPLKKKQVIDKFISDKMDLIIAIPTGPALVAKAAIGNTSTPLVFAMAGLEGNDLVDSVRQPGANVTGVRFPGPNLTVKRFEFLLELKPNIKKLYITYNVKYPANEVALKALRPLAASLNIILIEAPVKTVIELVANLEARSKMEEIGLDAIQILPDNLSQSPAGWAAISKFANLHRVPIAGAASFTAEKGAVFSYTPDNFEVGRLAAILVDKIFEGIPAGTIPVITPESYLRLSYKQAQKLGIDVPKGLLELATKIYR